MKDAGFGWCSAPGCLDAADLRADGVPYCHAHFEALLERENAVGIWPPLREQLPALWGER